MTNFRSKPNGQHYPLQKTRKAGSFATSTAHLGVPRKFGKKTIILKSSGRFSDEIYYKGKFIGSVRKLDSNSYLPVGINDDFHQPKKTQENSFSKRLPCLASRSTERCFPHRGKHRPSLSSGRALSGSEWARSMIMLARPLHV